MGKSKLLGQDETITDLSVDSYSVSFCRAQGNTDEVVFLVSETSLIHAEEEMDERLIEIPSFPVLSSLSELNALGEDLARTIRGIFEASARIFLLMALLPLFYHNV